MRIIFALTVIALVLSGLAIGLTMLLPGPTGPQGEQGPQGPQGPQGELKLIPGAGLNVTILNATISAGRKPMVTFNLTDAGGVPLKVSDLEGISFTIAVIEVDSQTGLTSYKNYITRTVTGKTYTVDGTTVQPALTSATQATTDSGGSFTEITSGRYNYTFGTTLPEGYNVAATHVVGVYAYKDNRQAVSNDVYPFVPNGSPVTVMRLISSTETCNSCHDPLQAHGGVRREFGLCILCHTGQTTDPETGNSVEFMVLIHKIHSGEHLSVLPYYIVGYRQSMHNYTDVVWPQDIRNCQTCHTGPQGQNYLTAPSRAACGSCHDDVNFATGANHPGGPQTSDVACSSCHASTMTKEFDASIPGAHVIPAFSSQLGGVNFQIVSVTNTAPGNKPVVVFNVKANNGTIIVPSTMTSLTLTLAGPTTDYVNWWRETRPRTASTSLGDGNYSYTFTASIPAGATGSYAVAIDGYINKNITKPDGSIYGTVRDVGYNVVVYVPVTDSTAVPRRTVVLTENCNQCHKDLALHGGVRKEIEYCVMCHNAYQTDVARRPAGTTPATVHFKYLIHRIHLGEEQTTPYIVYGFGNQSHDFSEVLFPGDLRNCAKCHVSGSYLLPLPSGVQPTTIKFANGTVAEVIPPTAAACSACHDSDYVKYHEEVMTTQAGGESCATCHGEGKEFAVSKVHSRESGTVSSIISPLSGSLAALMIFIGGIVTSITSRRKP